MQQIYKCRLMGRKKTIDKEPVTIRFKELANGNKSIYLDIYMDGKRSYEFLKLYLIPEVGRERAKARMKNAETMASANIIKAQRVLDLKNRKAGVFSSNKNMRLVEWLDIVKVAKQKASRSDESSKTIENVKKHIIKFCGESTKMVDIDKKFCMKWIEYLRTATKRGGQPFSEVTKKVYLTCFGTVLNQAVRDGIIQMNPLSLIDPSYKFGSPESERVHLDIEEVKKLAATECYSQHTKQAFMFSCFSGLRISDIRKLKWSDIEEVKNPDGTSSYRLTKTMEKTQRVVSYQLSNEAMKWLPEKTKDELVFYELCQQPNINYHIKVWAKAAGIKKNISFHTARHTFATMMLTLGADIYTTSKLLGHSRISTTEIYAKIVDKKKDEAMGLIDKFFDKE